MTTLMILLLLRVCGGSKSVILCRPFPIWKVRVRGPWQRKLICYTARSFEGIKSTIRKKTFIYIRIKIDGHISLYSLLWGVCWPHELNGEVLCDEMAILEDHHKIHFELDLEGSSCERGAGEEARIHLRMRSSLCLCLCLCNFFFLTI